MTLKAMLSTVSAVILMTSPASADMNETEERLFELLKTKPAFQALMPSGKRVQSLDFKGTLVPGLLEFDDAPENFEIKPLAIAGDIARNCWTDLSYSYTSEFNGSYEQTTSWQVSTELQVSQEVTVEGKIPLFGSASATSGVSLSLGTSLGKIEKTGIGFKKLVTVALPPNTEADVQLQVIEQVLEGAPFTVDMEMRGVAEILHPPKRAWIPYRRGDLPANMVEGGSERLKSGRWRDLNVCRVGAHAGKIIGKVCNWTFGGEERVARRFDVLTVSGYKKTWMKKKDFRDKYSDRTVAEGNAPVYYSGKENRPGKRYNGQNFVCRAKHKGDWHPGKVVINHCMIGYAGTERKKSAFEVLIRGKGENETTRVDVTGLLSPHERSFTVDGVFTDARSINAIAVLGNRRPTDRRFCGDVDPQIAQSGITEATVEEQLAITTNTRKPRGVFDSLSMDVLRSAPAKDAPPALETIEGTQLMVIDYIGQEVPKVTLNARLLFDRSPDMFGSDVAAVQQALVERGAQIEVDGFFGAETSAALRAFQREAGLPVDGRFGTRTRLAIGF
ncbi:MAG: DM9 repeat-containing protein [Pseudomonadota bacterium]